MDRSRVHSSIFVPLQQLQLQLRCEALPLGPPTRFSQHAVQDRFGGLPASSLSDLKKKTCSLRDYGYPMLIMRNVEKRCPSLSYIYV